VTTCADCSNMHPESLTVGTCREFKRLYTLRSMTVGCKSFAPRTEKAKRVNFHHGVPRPARTCRHCNEAQAFGRSRYCGPCRELLAEPPAAFDDNAPRSIRIDVSATEIVELGLVVLHGLPRDAWALQELINKGLVSVGELSALSLSDDGLRVWAAVERAFEMET
jgi:hypothetical protein